MKLNKLVVVLTRERDFPAYLRGIETVVRIKQQIPRVGKPLSARTGVHVVAGVMPPHKSHSFLFLASARRRMRRALISSLIRFRSSRVSASFDVFASPPFNLAHPLVDKRLLSDHKYALGPYLARSPDSDSSFPKPEVVRQERALDQG